MSTSHTTHKLVVKGLKFECSKVTENKYNKSRNKFLFYGSKGFCHENTPEAIKGKVQYLRFYQILQTKNIIDDRKN